MAIAFDLNHEKFVASLKTVHLLFIVMEFVQIRMDHAKFSAQQIPSKTKDFAQQNS